MKTKPAAEWQPDPVRIISVYPVSITVVAKLVIKQMQGPTANSAAVPIPSLDIF